MERWDAHSFSKGLREKKGERRGEKKVQSPLTCSSKTLREAQQPLGWASQLTRRPDKREQTAGPIRRMA